MRPARLARHWDRAGAVAEGRRFDVEADVRRIRDTLRELDDASALSATVVLVDVAAACRWWEWRGGGLLAELGRRRLPWTADDVELLFDVALRAEGVGVLSPLMAAAAAAEQLAPADRARCADHFERAQRRLDTVVSESAERARLRLRLRMLADTDTAPGVRTSVFHLEDGWGRAAVARLGTVTTGAAAVSDLLAHAATIPAGPRPTKAWLKRTGELLADRPGLVTLVRELLELAHTCEEAETEVWGYRFRRRIGTNNEDLARGLLWAAQVGGGRWLTPLVLELYAAGPEPRLLNTCFAVLGRRGDADAIGALVRLQRGTRDRGQLTQIASALAEAATSAGIPRSELVEMTIPDAGLDGRRERRFADGDVTAVLSLNDAAKVAVLWEHAGGRGPKPPASAGPELAATVKRAAAELKKLVAGERDRLEDLLVEEREWPLDTWRKRYADHPVTGSLANRLLWTVIDGGDRVAALPGPDGRFVLVDGRTIEPGPGARITVWHPVAADPEQVRAWRGYLLEHELAQPFKQAFREVYLLTPAEEETKTYSNRFAAHILHYHQAYALMKERRWASNYLGHWDGGYEGEARREFPAHGLRAVFFHEPVDEDGNDGTVRYCATDQVRFQRARGRGWETVPLADVPPAVFSEAMRDVDLFIGVSSIAADPTWADRGTDRHFEYWERAAFGDLTANGQVRRQVIAHLLPKLKIRDRARLEGNYVVVQGQRRTYRIHVGSGNILMSPNDRYLCVVPSRRTVPGVRFVPFEGDALLAIILSKAFMLADDHRITDPSILRQIG